MSLALLIPELGNFALVLAFCLAVVQCIIPIAGSYLGRETWQRLAKPTAIGQFAFILFAFCCLEYAFLSNDFSVTYVANNSNTHLPWFYRIGALWGAHEGSLLLWTFILSVWTFAVCLFSRSLPLATLARVLGILGFISAGFLLFMLTTSNPFLRDLVNLPTEGADLNPVLQDPGLVGHPPMLYMGYVGFAVAFAFAIASLLSGKLDTAWARWTRPWTTSAWCFLTCGITLGSWWSYRVLGWGGWWFWDPVENASLMPWLVGTALIHSLAVAEKRNAFKNWTILLAIFAFSLSLIGTFLVRSGILNSVHSFAVDPKRGLFILVFLSIVIGGSLTLFAWRAWTMQASSRFTLWSRETFLLSNNILLVVAAATVLLGTLYPLIIQSLGLGIISVGPPYFNLVVGLLTIPLLFFMAVAPLARWKQTDIQQMIRDCRYLFVVTIVLTFALLWWFTERWYFSVVLGFGLALWIIIVSLKDLWQKSRRFTALRKLNASYYGMLVAHMGMAVLAMGIVFNTNYTQQNDVRLAPGESTTLAGYQFTFLNEVDYVGPNYDGIAVNIQISKDQQVIAVVPAIKKVFRASGVTMTDAAISINPVRDIYISLGNPLDHGAWTMRLYYKPFVRWIWFGGLLMLLGGFLTLVDRRYRLKPLRTLT